MAVCDVNSERECVFLCGSWTTAACERGKGKNSDRSVARYTVRQTSGNEQTITKNKKGGITSKACKG